MSDFVNSVILNADFFILIIFRTGALTVSSPIFGRSGIPNIVKICFTLSLGIFFFTVSEPVGIQYTTLIGFMLLIAREILIGAALGWVTNVFFTSAYAAGQLIDMQIGLGIVSVYDQQNNTQVPVTGNILNIVLLLVFFALDGHHRLIHIVYLTIEHLPVGILALNANIGYVALEVFAEAFLIGVMVAMPVIASGLILEIAFGVLARTVPQMNMFVVGIPIKTLIGFIMLSILIPAFVYFADDIFSAMFDAVELMFSTFMEAT